MHFEYCRYIKKIPSPSGARQILNALLSNRGVADAVRMGGELKRLAWKPEVIISSPAIRAKKTCEKLCDKLEFVFDNVVWNKDIYAA